MICLNHLVALPDAMDDVDLQISMILLLTTFRYLPSESCLLLIYLLHFSQFLEISRVSCWTVEDSFSICFEVDCVVFFYGRNFASRISAFSPLSHFFVGGFLGVSGS